jgi:autotransporter-associated beta strand protein
VLLYELLTGTTPFDKAQLRTAAPRWDGRDRTAVSSLFRRSIMSPNWLHHWFREKTWSKRGQRRKARTRVRLELEQLENRVVPVVFTWTGAAPLDPTDGLAHWSNPANWSGANGQHPLAVDDFLDDALDFPGTAALNRDKCFNDLGNVATSQIRIEGSGYTITGGTIVLDTNAPGVEGLLVQADNDTLSTNLQLNDKLQDMVLSVSDTNTFTLSGIISSGTSTPGVSGFRKQGTGTLILAPSANNTYTGNTTVDDGVLEIRQAAALGAVTSGTTVNDPGTLRLALASSGGTEPLTLFGTGGTTNRGALNCIEGDSIHRTVWNGDITLSSTAVVVRVDVVDVSAALDLHGRIHGFNNGLTMIGTGALFFSGDQANDYTGTTRVNSGLLILSKVGVTAVNGPLVVGDGNGTANAFTQGGAQASLEGLNQTLATASVTVNVDGVIDLKNHNQTFGDLTLNGGLVTSTAGLGFPSETLTLNGNVLATSIASGGTNHEAAIGVTNLNLGHATRRFTVNDGPATRDLIVQAVVSGEASVGLTKSGPGRMTIVYPGHDNTYTGFTIVNGGILEDNGQQENSATFVNTGGTLAGKGTVGPLTVNAGGTARPGAGQSLSVSGNASFANSLATYSADLIATSVGALGATGTLALNNATLHLLDVNIPTQPGLLPPLGVPLPILGGAAITGTFNGLPNNAIAVSVSGLAYRVTYTPNNVFVTRLSGPAFQERAITTPIDEGSVATLTGHISTMLPTDTFFLEVNWGDGSRTQTFRFGPNASRAVVLQHRYLDDGVYTVGLLWRDQRGAFNTDTLTVSVKNVAPVVDAGGDATLHGGTLNRQVTFTDPGRDTWTATVDFGDGSPPQVFDLRDSTRFQLRHRFGQPGTYRVTVTVFDDDGGVGAETFRVIVPSRP